MQRSPYLCIDDNISGAHILRNYAAKFMRLNRLGTDAQNELFDARDHELDAQMHARKEDVLRTMEKHQGAKDLSIRFCPTHEVNRKRQQLLAVKAQFLLRLSHMRTLGKRHELLKKVNAWIEDNVD